MVDTIINIMRMGATNTKNGLSVNFIISTVGRYMNVWAYFVRLVAMEIYERIILTNGINIIVIASNRKN